MPVDSLLAVRTASDGNLTATATLPSSGLRVGAHPNRNFVLEVMVPSVSGTSPTLDITISQSQTQGGAYSVHTTMPQITAAGVYAIRFSPKYDYCKVTFTVGGTSPNFGATTAYIKDNSIVADVR